MARNEEKQLARLNRFYLQKQKEEELKKRPPRPKLESLTTSKEITKWLPTITRDIDFYVKQMEVPCYQDSQIEEFTRRIGHLKGEYKAYLRKLRELNPEDKTTPWTDRPYAVKRQKVSSSHKTTGSKENENNHSDSDEESNQVDFPANFTPLCTPILDDDEQNLQNFGYEKPVIAACPDLSDESMNQPLQFVPMAYSVKSNVNNKAGGKMKTATCQIEQEADREASSTKQNVSPGIYESNESKKISGVLNLPYSDSSSSGDET